MTSLESLIADSRHKNQTRLSEYDTFNPIFMNTPPQIKSEIIDIMFEGHSDKNWVGDISALNDPPTEFIGDCIPAVADSHHLIIGFNKYAIYNYNLNIFSYENSLLKTIDGTNFTPAQQHRFIAIFTISTANNGVTLISPMCNDKKSDALRSSAEFPKVIYRAIDHYSFKNPDVKQYIFAGGKRIADTVAYIEQQTKSGHNTRSRVKMLNNLAKPFYAFEVTRPRLEPQAHHDFDI